MVYVLDCNNKPIMPTKDHGKVRFLLKTKKAVVVNNCPFTIKLKSRSKTYTQPVTLGVDSGSKVIGLSASTEKEGWLAPSIQHKINSHLKVIANIHKLLPITKTVVEVASFDIQLINNPSISGTGYQSGEQLGFWNVREYVLFRDGHICQCCHGKSKDKRLNVHHIESRKTGGNAPNNLITLCESCHNKCHEGEISLPKTIKRGMSFRDAVFMGIMRWELYNNLKKNYTNVYLTYGYITKHIRITNSLPKTHAIDALCIAGNPSANRLDKYYLIRKVRCHNRQLHKATINKGGVKKLNQAPKYVFSFQLFDKVKYKGETAFIYGRRSSGSFDIRKLDGTKLSAGVSYKKFRLINKRRNYLIEVATR